MNFSEQMKSIAIFHAKDMEDKYKDLINKCVDKTTIYDVSYTEKVGTIDIPKVKILNITTQDFILSTAGTMTVLNFASYKNAGGMFINGSRAQEEMLCHYSFLYNVLCRNTNYYDWNKGNLNRGMYLNRALYTPDILFIGSKGKMKYADVLTCAAPNYSVALRYGRFTKDENSKALVDRITFIRNIVESRPNDILVLGAYGCGVFEQNPLEVAEIFKETFKTSNFKEIVYPIPGGVNLEAFKRVFENK